MGRPDLLFAGADISAVLGGHERKMLDELNALGSAQVLYTAVDAWCDHFEQEYRVAVPQLHENQIAIDYGEADIDVRGRFDYFVRDTSRPAYVKGTGVAFFIPFEGDKNLFNFRPSSYALSQPHATVTENELILSYARTDHDANAVKSSFQDDLAKIRGNLDRLRADVQPFNDALRSKVKARLDARRQKHLADQGLASSLGFPLRRRAAAPQTYTLPVVRRKPPVRRPAPTGTAFAPEPELDLAEYEHILSVISNMVAVMERSPQAFGTLGEEDLRWHFLFQLNGQYEGQATGETFNFHGKTDILIRADNRNVFIAECKIWRGPKSFTEALDQLLGYAAWRDTKTALLIFNRGKSFSAVVNQIPDLVKAQQNFHRQLAYQSETGFRFALHHRDDPARELLLTILSFEVPA